MVPVIIIILAAGIAVLTFFLLKNIFQQKKKTSASNLKDKNTVLKAMREAKAAIEKDPQNSDAHYLLGKAYMADKRDEQAFREYKSVSRLGIAGTQIPETEFRETLASLYTKYHEEEEALKEYLLLIKLHPENPEYYFLAGRLFSTRNRADLAEQYLRKAASIYPKEVRYRFELGNLYYTSKKLKEASGEFEAILKLDPTNGLALLNMGKVLKDSKDFSGALPYLERASRDLEIKLRALVELGGCYMSLKMLDKAIQELERAVDIISKEADLDSLYARYFLAMCYEKTQEFTKAVAQWDKIYSQKKNFRDVGEKLTQYIEYRAGNEDKDQPRK